MKARNVAGVSAAAGLLVVLAGCVPASDPHVEYIGSYPAAAHACAWMAMNAGLRDDARIPSFVDVRNLSTVGSGGSVTVTGETYVEAGSSQTYSWRCSVVQSDTELNARITDFGPAPAG